MSDYSLQSSMNTDPKGAFRSKPWFLRAGENIETDQYPLLDWHVWQKVPSAKRKAAAWYWYRQQVRRHEINAGEKLALWVIVDTLNTNSACSTITATGLADMAGMARTTASRLLLDLNEKNIIWSYMDGMPEVRPSRQREVILKNIRTVQRRNLRRYHCLVGLHFALANTLQE